MVRTKTKTKVKPKARKVRAKPKASKDKVVAPKTRHISVQNPPRPYVPGFCRWCGEDVHRLSPRARTFCSPECLHEWKLRSDPKYLAKEMFKRDRGICSECGMDTIQLMTELFYHIAVGVCPNWASDPQKAYERAQFLATRNYKPSNYIPRAVRVSPEAIFIEATFLENNGLKSYRLVTALLPRKRLWEIDHILAVYEGGGQCGLDNLRTLCYWCHKKHTQEQVLARAEKKI